ncbi:hypothetical protein M501DRAFT_993303 [Patellaria atrata CBS 101060]|uniref:Uncharacterized protein n=1 Tax=Patellaria atrata CBS 101060 TaxID=1346257 RepID=A0A9P4SIU4_9PEZI|nr:hypothetical protein M501DRAFT_993303 [Patellaria atrata CBS 101060]
MHTTGTSVLLLLFPDENQGAGNSTLTGRYHVPAMFSASSWFLDLYYVEAGNWSLLERFIHRQISWSLFCAFPTKQLASDFASQTRRMGAHVVPHFTSIPRAWP